MSNFQLFRNTVRSSTAPAAGGTQSNELQAAIKSVTSSTDVGAVFLYDTSQDSDGGAWRKKCKGLSWFDEAASATRSARSQFPSIALIVADNVSSGTSVTIYDLDDPAMPVWLVVNEGGLNLLWSSAVPSAITALNGRIYVGTDATTGLLTFDFANDLCYGMRASTTGYQVGNISERNAGNASRAGYFSAGIVNAAVNDVAATVLEGAEIGALGLPIPTVAVACNADGISVIHPNGDVYDQKNGGGYGANQVFWGDDALYGNFVTGTARRMNRFPLSSLYADNTPGTAASQVIQMTSDGWTSVGMALGQSQDAAVAAGKDTIAQGGTSGLQILKVVPAKTVGSSASETDSAAAHITSTYNTGYMVGDIRGAWLAGSMTADRSVKANTLTRVGTGTAGADVATDAELQAYTGFSSSSYFSRANDADFDFGTGDFSIMFWVKDSGAEFQDILGRADATPEAGDWLLQGQDDRAIDWYRHSGSGWVRIQASTFTRPQNEWVQVVAVRRSGVFNWYFNGEFDSSVADTNSYTPSGGSALTVGRLLGNAEYADNTSLSLLRISATAPTPQQIKEIYDAEKPLFRSGAKCLLQGDNSAVQGLAYDKTTGILQATQTAGTTNASATMFRGLEVADTFLGNAHDSSWTYNSATLLAANGGVSTYYRGSGSLLCDLPALDVRAELNEGQDKTPSDGKFHFEGVTPNATPVVIGQIPVGEGESLTARVLITGHEYNDSTTGYTGRYEIKQGYYRGISGTTTARSEMSKLFEEGSNSLDATLVADTSAQTIKIKVTGDGSNRMVWTAEVEVQRISEKQYER